MHTADLLLLITSVIVFWKMAKNFDIFPAEFIIFEYQDIIGKIDC